MQPAKVILAVVKAIELEYGCRFERRSFIVAIDNLGVDVLAGTLHLPWRNLSGSILWCDVTLGLLPDGTIRVLYTASNDHALIAQWQYRDKIGILEKKQLPEHTVWLNRLSRSKQRFY